MFPRSLFFHTGFCIQTVGFSYHSNDPQTTGNMLLALQLGHACPIRKRSFSYKNQARSYKQIERFIYKDSPASCSDPWEILPPTLL